MSEIVTDPEAFPHVFDAALNAGDLDAIVALYEDGAILRVQSGEARSGSAAVRAEMRQLIAAQAHLTNTLRHTFRNGDVALIVVDYALRLGGPGENAMEVRGTATNVLRHDPQKGWRMIIANPQGVV